MALDLKVDMEKSFRIFSEECGVVEWPLCYLGLPIIENSNSMGFWAPIIDKINERLDVWRKKLFV